MMWIAILYLCSQLVSARAIPIAVESIEYDYEKYISEIPDICLSDIATPRELLPDKEAFVAIKRAVLKSTFSAMETIFLGAGQGTSGTRTGQGWCSDIFNLSRTNIHYTSISPKPSFVHRGQASTHNFVFNYLGHALKKRRPAISKRRKASGVLPSSISSREFQREHGKALSFCFHDMLTLSPPLGCLSDAPWVAYFTELFYASCPRTKVFLFTRDSLDWAESRQRKHSNSRTGFICPVYEQIQHDPFSITQCAHSRAMQNGTHRFSGEALDNHDLSATQLAAQYRKYNIFVRNLVPKEKLLEIKLISHNDTSVNHTEYDTSQFELLKQFFSLL